VDDDAGDVVSDEVVQVAGEFQAFVVAYGVHGPGPAGVQQTPVAGQADGPADGEGQEEGVSEEFTRRAPAHRLDDHRGAQCRRQRHGGDRPLHTACGPGEQREQGDRFQKAPRTAGERGIRPQARGQGQGAQRGDAGTPLGTRPVGGEEQRGGGERTGDKGQPARPPVLRVVVGRHVEQPHQG
jgi:hypothetical protein